MRKPLESSRGCAASGETDLRAYDPTTKQSVRFLLCDNSGRLVNRERLNRALKRVAVSAGISENVHLHRLRHTYATELLRQGVSLPGVMRLLGHRTLKMTLQYVLVTNEDLGKAYMDAADKAHKRYSGLKTLGAPANSRHEDGPDKIASSLDQIVANVQRYRFEHPEPTTRKKLGRLVERLRRIEHDLATLLL